MLGQSGVLAGGSKLLLQCCDLEATLLAMPLPLAVEPKLIGRQPQEAGVLRLWMSSQMYAT